MRGTFLCESLPASPPEARGAPLGAKPFDLCGEMVVGCGPVQGTELCFSEDDAECFPEMSPNGGEFGAHL